MNDFTDLEKVDDDGVRIRLFAQSLIGETRKWYTGLEIGSISNLRQLNQVFLSHCEVKKNSL